MPIGGAKAGSLLQQEKKIVGSAVGNRREAIEALELVQRGVVKVEYRVEPMDKLSDIFKEMEDGKLQGRVVLDLS